MLDLGSRVTGSSIGAALRIFADAGLAEIAEDDDGRYIALVPVDGKVDLTRNERFAEGEAERESFAAFSDLALRSEAALLERVINRPIYPSNVPMTR